MCVSCYRCRVKTYEKQYIFSNIVWCELWNDIEKVNVALFTIDMKTNIFFLNFIIFLLFCRLLGVFSQKFWGTSKSFHKNQFIAHYIFIFIRLIRNKTNIKFLFFPLFLLRLLYFWNYVHIKCLKIWHHIWALENNDDVNCFNEEERLKNRSVFVSWNNSMKKCSSEITEFKSSLFPCFYTYNSWNLYKKN